MFAYLLCSSALMAQAAHSKPQWLTIDNSILAQIRPSFEKGLSPLYKAGSASVVRMDDVELEKVSHVIHQKFHRCGGFMSHDSYEEAEKSLSDQGESYFARRAVFADYRVDQMPLVRQVVADVSEPRIREMILRLSSFFTRHCKSPSGVKATEFIANVWSELVSNRKDAKVELVKHKGFPQASVVLTILGSERPGEIVILGGHADSVGNVPALLGSPSPKKVAPGADDNASGIASMTEVIRVLVANDFKPKRTVQFMAYAGEEIGLKGSGEIAREYRKAGRNVVGMMQLDMVLQKGSADKDIWLATDFTNRKQNEFLGQLINEYVKVPWGTFECGYACSDHASWTENGYPSSFPFEAYMDNKKPNNSKHNKRVHSAEDTLQAAGGDATHASKFTKLAGAFVVELAN